MTDDVTLSAAEYARLLAIASNQFGWGEKQLREVLRTGVVSFHAGTGAPLHQHPLFARAPPIKIGTA